MPYGVLVQVQSRAPNKLFIVKAAARAVFIVLIAIKKDAVNFLLQPIISMCKPISDVCIFYDQI